MFSRSLFLFVMLFKMLWTKREEREESNMSACQVETQGDGAARKSGSSAWATCPLNEPCPEGLCCLFTPCHHKRTYTHTSTHTGLTQNMHTKKKKQKNPRLSCWSGQVQTCPLCVVFTHTENETCSVLSINNSSTHLGKSSFCSLCFSLSLCVSLDALQLITPGDSSF